MRRDNGYGQVKRAGGSLLGIPDTEDGRVMATTSRRGRPSTLLVRGCGIGPEAADCGAAQHIHTHTVSGLTILRPLMEDRSCTAVYIHTVRGSHTPGAASASCSPASTLEAQYTCTHTHILSMYLSPCIHIYTFLKTRIIIS